jgi:hypothetical protein
MARIQVIREQIFSIRRAGMGTGRIEELKTVEGDGYHSERSSPMLKLCSILTAIVISCALVCVAKDFPLVASSIVPAAKGSVDVDKDRNGNTELKIKVEHLAQPENLSPSQSSYVVWLQDKESEPENLGELRVNGKLEGSFQTVTPHKSFDLFVTGEKDATAKTPYGPEVLRTRITR